MRFLSTLLLVSIALAAHARGSELLQWRQLSDLPSELGVAGPFVGVHKDTLIVAGGANFPEPVWDNEKVWHDTIYGLSLEEPEAGWQTLGKLPRPLGYGAAISVPRGIICLGGNGANQVYADVFMIQITDQGVQIEPLPSLPSPMCYGDAAMIGSTLYVATGTTGLGLETATKQLWSLDWAHRDEHEIFRWKTLTPWPGEARAFHSLAAQHNGHTDCLYLIGGRNLSANGETQFLRDVYEFNPLQPDSPWRKRASLPEPLAAGTVAPVGQSHLFTLGGADGSLFAQADDLRDDHPGFPLVSLAYHTITDTWIAAGSLPQNQVTTKAVPWGDRILLASGEIRPRVRTKGVWEISPQKTEVTFGAANWIAIALYLGAVMGIGFFFARRNHDTEDFFRGGKRVPGWVAGLSIFATLLSSITFVALPARAFASDWIYIIINAGILICAPLVVFAILPHFRKIDATSAYEYLEQRFNLAIRLFASASFVLFQIGRMAIVMYLPSLALAAVTPLSLEGCILIMGVLSVIYCTLGGFEAVVWTDALQAIVLITGAILSFVIMTMGLEGGFGELKEVATANDKLRWADFDWSATSYMSTAFWVMVLGGIGSSLIPYSSDQAVVQRYVSTSTAEKARNAIWLNAGLAAVATFLFFGLGTGLYAFYKAHPASLDPTFKTDSIFPLFISRELPAGIAGIVIAAVFAAAQSTISTSMNSTSTAIVTDFFERLGWKQPASGGLVLARILTVVLGILGTLCALLLAWGDIESAWKTFLTIIGFVMGPLCGVFLLGMFTSRANATGAVIGAALGVTALLGARYLTPMNGLLYAPLGITVSFVAGYVGSLLALQRSPSSK
ncbi:MAG: sodium/solute symporter [Verrucomicrobiota bacterium]